MRLLGSRIGHFRIDSQIGQGGMGRVYRGYDETLQRAVAIKVLRSHSRTSTEARARFIREARILSGLHHPSICQIYDLVEHRGDDFLILELVEGETMSRERLAELPYDDQLRLAGDLADVLVTAHRAGVVHRDLKPDNLMLTPEGKLKVLDFGIARRFGATQDLESPTPETPSPTLEDASEGEGDSSGANTPGSGEHELDATLVHPFSLLDGSNTVTHFDPGSTFVTDDHSLVGTLSYMSPEQAQNRQVTPASDMFSFGILLLEMLTGRRAYEEDLDPIQQYHHVIQGRIGSMQGLTPDWAELIQALTDLSPSQRPSASAVLVRLERIRSKPERRRRRRQRTALIAAAAVAVTAIVALMVHSRFQSQRAAAIAGELALQTRDVEWVTRAAALSPPRDIRPLRAQVYRHMDALKGRIQALGKAAQGPGLHALARSAAALGRPEEALRHLGAAKDLGYFPPGAAADLGHLLLRLYEQRSTELYLQLAPDERQEPMAELRREYRDPGLDYLRQAQSNRQSKTSGWLSRETAGLDAAVIALHEGRWSDAVAAAEQAVAEQPRLYEAHMVVAQTHIQHSHEQALREDYEGVAESRRQARAALQKAAQIGRGDLQIHKTLCDLAELEIQPTLHHLGGEIQPFLDYGIEACGTALEIDPDDSGSSGLLSVLLFRRAEWNADPSIKSYEQAAEHARRTLEMDPSKTWVWNTLGNIYTAWADRLYYKDHQDPSEIIPKALEAFRHASELAPASTRPLNGIGNICSLYADYLYRQGSDPSEQVDLALETYEKAIALASNLDMIYSNMLWPLISQTRYQLDHSIDPGETIRRAVALGDRALKDRPKLPGLLTAYATLSSLQALWLSESRQSAFGSSAGAQASPTASSSLERAVALGLRSLEIYPDNYYTRLAMAEIHLIAAQISIRKTGSGIDELRKAASYLSSAREQDPWDLELKRLVALHERLSAGAGRN